MNEIGDIGSTLIVVQIESPNKDISAKLLKS